MDSTIAQLPAVSSVNITDYVPVDQGGVTKKAQAGQLSVPIYSAFSLSSGSSLIGFIQNLFGAVARTLQDKNREIVSVKDFGAAGDGVIDDITSITAAINALPATGGAIVFPTGTYLVSNPITIGTSLSNITLIAMGYAVIKKNANTHGVFIQGNNNTVQGLVVNGNGKSSGGIYCTGANNRIILNRVTNNGGIGIGQNGTSTTCYNNMIALNQVDGITNNTGIGSSFADYSIVFGNTIQMSTGGAEGLACNAPTNCIFGFNTATGSFGGAGGIGCDQAIQTTWIGNLSHGNNNGFNAVEHNGGGVSNAVIGNVLVSNTNSGTYARQGNGLVLQNNTIGYIQKTSTLVGGTLYTDGFYGSVPLTGGTGANAKANITISGGSVTGFYLIDGGTGYSVNDVLSATAASIGGTGSGFSKTVAGVGSNLAIDPNGNYGKNWSIIGNVIEGNDTLQISIDNATTSVLPSHQIIGNAMVNSGYEPTLEQSTQLIAKPSAISYSLSTNQTNATGNAAVYVIPFDTKVNDIGGDYNTGTHKFIAPVAGYYNFSLGVRATAATGATIGTLILLVDKLSSTYTIDGNMSIVNTSEMRGSMSANSIFLEQNWTVQARVQISGLAGNTAAINNNSANTWFSGGK